MENHRNEVRKGSKDSHGASECHARTGKGKSLILSAIRAGITCRKEFLLSTTGESI